MAAATSQVSATPAGPPSRLKEAGWYSRLSYGWMSSLIWSNRKNPIQESQLTILDTEKADASSALFEQYWQEEVQSGKPSLWRALRRAFSRDFYIAGIFKLFWGTFTILGAYYFVSSLLRFSEGNSQAWYDGWIYSAFFFLDCLLLSICLQQMSAYAAKVGIRVRGAMMTAVFRKSLKLANVGNGAGDIVNLMSIDCHKLLEGSVELHYLWSAPLEAAAIIILLLTLVGISALPALGVLLLIIPIQYKFGLMIAANRKKIVKITDSRVQVMHEILLAIKLVKFYVWEQSFAKHVAELREQEIKMMRRSAIIKSINLMLVFIVPPLIAILMFTTYVSIQSKLTASIAFTTLSLFNTLRFPLVVLPKALKAASESMSAVARLEKFLLEGADAVPRVKHDKIEIKFENTTWTYGDNAEPALQDITFEVKQGELMAIVGPVGSGKSSILNAILGTMNKQKGNFSVGGKIAYVPQTPWVQMATLRDNVLFGAPMEEARYKEVIHTCALTHDLSLLSHGDMTELGERGINLSGGQRQRVNIARAAYKTGADIYLLDNPLSAVDQHTSKHIFDLCFRGLLQGKTIIFITHQLELLPYCDTVAFMEEGRFSYWGPPSLDQIKKHFPDWSGLDGGDVSPIPAALPPAPTEEPALKKVPSAGQLEQLVKTNDPAVDVLERKLSQLPEVERRLSSFVERKPSMERKASSRVLDRKPSQHGEEGKLERRNSLEDLRKLQKLPRHSFVEDKHVKKIMKKSNASLKVKEDKSTGGKSLSRVFLDWCHTVSYPLAFLSLSVFAITQTVRIVSDNWIRFWVADALNQSQVYYMWTYAAFVGGFCIALIFRGLIYYFLVLRASTKLHNDMFSRVLRAPMSFFNTIPLGRVLNCFSQDQDTIDESMPDTVHMTTIYLMILLTTLIIVAITIPLYAAVIGGLVGGYWLLQTLYLPAAAKLKALAGLTSPPVYSHLAETLNGIDVIRAFEAEDIFRKENVQRIDRNHTMMFNLEMVHLWLGFRMDALVSCLVLATCLFSVGLKGTIAPAAAGLAISNSIQKLIFSKWVVRGMSDAMSQLSSVERILHYTNKCGKEPEKFDESGQQLEVAPTVAIQDRPELQSWPSTGTLEFRHVVFRYLPLQAPVLKNVSFTIRDKEKIGIVGRTGSGKTSVIMALFRMFELSSGHILLDNVDIATLNLADLRERLAIIPQEPVMFKGTLRSNLDPFHRVSDEQIWAALKQVHLAPTIEANPLKLECIVEEGGNNFSLGQKQLVCIARAILKKTKVLLLDEATAAMDLATDALIQTTIRREFADRTVLTIAHRLDTIIESDRILVLDSGRVEEFDSAANLLRVSEGVFSHLVNQTGPVAAAGLRAMAVKKEREAAAKVPAAPSTSSTLQPFALSSNASAVQSLAKDLVEAGRTRAPTLPGDVELTVVDPPADLETPRVR